MFRITKVKVKKDNRRKGERGGVSYSYLVFSFQYFSILFQLSIGVLGIKNIDITFKIKRGWN